MNPVITYEELLKLTINQFNARKGKTIQELLLYLYHHNGTSIMLEYAICLDEIYNACRNLYSIMIPILNAIDELIENTDCEDCKRELEGFKEEYMQGSLELDTPINHAPNIADSVSAYMDILSFFFGVFEILEEWEYDLGKLFIPFKKERNA